MGNIWATTSRTNRDLNRKLQKSLYDIHVIKQTLSQQQSSLGREESQMLSELNTSLRETTTEAELKMKATQIVFIRKMRHRLTKSSMQIYSIETELKMSQSMTFISKSMQNIARILKAMNRSLDLPAIKNIAMTFSRESEMLSMKQETIDDAIEDSMQDEESETETDQLVQQLLDSARLQMQSGMEDVPTKIPQQHHRAAGDLTLDVAVIEPPSSFPLSPQVPPTLPSSSSSASQRPENKGAAESKRRSGS